jgi:hypothetical protein
MLQEGSNFGFGLEEVGSNRNHVDHLMSEPARCYTFGRSYLVHIDLSPPLTY